MSNGRLPWALLLVAVIAGCVGAPTVAPRLILETGTRGAHIRLSPGERFLATTSDDAAVRIWNLTPTGIP